MKILKFYTKTCAPCKVLGRILSKIEGLEIEEIDAMENLELVDKYNVCTTPTLIFLNELGEEVNRTVGMVKENEIREILNT